jgi:HK97 family phage prohead protease
MHLTTRTTMQQFDLQAVELAAKQAWQSSAALRAEFCDDEQSFMAYRRAEARGGIRIHTSNHVVHGEARAVRHFTLDAFAMSGAGARCSVTLSGPQRGRVTGYGAVFGGINRKSMRIKQGAFRKAVSRVPLPMLWAHDRDKPIGSWTALREDSFGLLAEGQINLNVAAGRDAFALLEGRDVTGLSVGFDAPDKATTVVGDVTEFSEVDLLEISIAPVPAEDRARVTSVEA